MAGRGGFKVVQKIFIHTQTNPLKIFVLPAQLNQLTVLNRDLQGGLVWVCKLLNVVQSANKIWHKTRKDW